MMMKKELSLLLILLAGFALNSNAQDEQPERWTIKIDVQHKDIPLQEDLSIGQLGVSDVVRIRPFYSADIQYFLNKGEKRKLFLSGRLGTYVNLYQDRWLTAQIGLGLERRFFKRFIVLGRMETGIARISSRDPQYLLEDGQWVPTSEGRVSGWGMMLNPRLEIGYRILEGERTLDAFVNSHAEITVHPEFGTLPYLGYGIGVRTNL